MCSPEFEARRADPAPHEGQAGQQIQSAPFNPAPGEERPLASLATPQPVTPQQEVMNVALEAVRDVGLIIEEVKTSRHETLRAIAEAQALSASIERVSTTLSTAGSECATKNAVIAAAHLPALIDQLKPHENTHPSLATIAKLLSRIEGYLTDPDSADIEGLQQEAAHAKGAVTTDLKKIDNRNEADARILHTGVEAVRELGIVWGAAKGVEKETLRAIAKDKDLEEAISRASGLLKVKEDSAIFEPIAKDDAAKIAAALRDLVEKLTPHTQQHPSVSGIVTLLQDLNGALLSEKMPDLSAFNEKFDAVRSDVEKYRTTFTERCSAERTPAADTPLYQELFGSVEARERHAEAMESMFERLKDAVVEVKPTGVAMDRYGDVGAVLMRLKNELRESPQEYIGAIKEVLGCALALRESGFKHPALNEIIMESVRAAVAAETGQLCRITVADRGIFDSLIGSSRRGAVNALAGVFGDDYAMKTMAKGIARSFDVTVLTREETCRKNLQRLPERAVEEMAKVYRENGRKAADEYEGSLKKNPWVTEGERFGITFSELSNALKEVQREISREKVAELQDRAPEEMVEVYRENGRAAAEEYERTLEQDPWVKEGERFGVTFKLQKPPLYIAQVMVDSYAFDNNTGVSTFTVPAGVTDVEAMKALNEYFRKHLPNFGRDAVYAGDLDWYENLPKEYSTHCQERNYSQARQITITGVVKGTNAENRTTQESVLRDDTLVFSDPRDQAIAAALHACKHDGQDLFKDLWVRGSVPGFALGTSQYVGVDVAWCFGDFGCCHVAASGSPSPELKKT